MLDPFPLAAPAALSAATQRLTDRLPINLTTLPLHVHEVLLAFLLYYAINVLVAPVLSRRLCPRAYAALSPTTKINWDVHVVSFVQSCVINALALWTIWHDRERAQMDWRERVWGYTGACGLVQALATGYFMWDLWVTLRNVHAFGWGMLAHAVCALWVFSLGYRPFINYYGPVFILYELSSPFLNIHWFCDKLSLTGSWLQFVNGIVLILTFFASRLVWGVYNSFRVFGDIFACYQYQSSPAGRAWLEATRTFAAAGVTQTESQGNLLRFAGAPIPLWLAVTYLGANVTLTVLNVFWFGKMIETVRARFAPPVGTKPVASGRDAHIAPFVGRATRPNGSKTVEVDATTVRQRKGGRDVHDDVPPPAH